jgi:hypothetical protein
VTHRIFFAFVAALLLGACGLLDDFTFEVVDKRPIAPGEEYASWWSATEACSGETGDPGRIRWYTAAGITYNGVFARGVWLPPHEIVVLLGYEENSDIVRHEMLHDLLGGDSDHAKPAWTRCELIDF